MDPNANDLILTALETGAATALQATASAAIKDAYRGFKGLIQRKLTGKSEDELALQKHEEKPAVWRAPLQEALAQHSIDQDPEIIQAAQQLLALIHPEQAAKGKYVVQIKGNVQGLVQGDHTQVQMHFGDAPKES